jgi:Tfp pilus assembly protein PilE
MESFDRRLDSALGTLKIPRGTDMSFRQEGRGVTLVETMIAVLVAFIAMASVGAVVFSSMVANKNQGTETTRLTALAQEKMEQLARLNYGDTTTNTTLITDPGWAIGLTANTSTDLTQLTDCPAAGSANIGYVDFLDNNAQPLSGACATAVAGGFGYVRRWKITTVSGVPGLKQISVVVYALNAVQAGGAKPSVALTTLKSQ